MNIQELRKAANANASKLLFPELHGKVMYDVKETAGSSQLTIQKLVGLEEVVKKPASNSSKAVKSPDLSQDELLQIGAVYVTEWLPSKKQMTRLQNLKKPTDAQLLEEDEWALAFHNADKVISQYTEGQRVRAAAAYRKTQG